jgi:serine/threonine protein kinase
LLSEGPRSLRDRVIRLDGFTFLRTLTDNASFLAENQRTGQRVVIRPCVRQSFLGLLLDEASTLQLFNKCLRDARIAARLEHRYLLKVHAVIEQADAFFIVQDFIDGIAIHQMPGFTPQLDLPDLFAKVAEGLQHAHLHGLIHGQLKPGEILVDSAGVPHVQFPRIPTGGTPSYVAPDLFLGEADGLDGRVDVWSLGVVLYECLTGNRPFATGSGYLTSHPTPLRQYNSRIPKELEAICLRCLARNPTERYPTASDLAADLRDFHIREKTSGKWKWLWPFRRRRG